MDLGLQSVKRGTSYHHVPGSRRMWTSQISVQNATEQTSIPDLPFLRKASYLYKMCPLVNFETKKSSFKKYEASLVSYCHSITKNQALVHAAVFDVIEGLNVSNADPEAVYFAIIQKAENIEKALLCGLLVCVELPPEMEEHLHERYIYYPLMVLTGNLNLRKIVQMWFQKEFQGKSSPMMLSPVDLSWVLSLWTGKVQESHESRAISLGFQVTEEGINQIEIAIKSNDLKKLWDLIHPDPKDDMFTISQLNAFMKEIEAFIYNAFKLRLGMLKLSKIMTTIASVSSDGIFKLHSQDYIIDVLRLLCSFSAEQLICMWTFLPQANQTLAGAASSV